MPLLPCAAAVYDQPVGKAKGAWYLMLMLRNAGDECLGSDAALVCHLIRTSKEVTYKSQPLHVHLETQGWKNYYESFGCASDGGEDLMTCKNGEPAKCEAHPRNSFLSKLYFGSDDRRLPGLFDANPERRMYIPEKRKPNRAELLGRKKIPDKWVPPWKREQPDEQLAQNADDIITILCTALLGLLAGGGTILGVLYLRRATGSEPERRE
eukprot:gnl/TRDRNA2_/TRDRNA2_81871_c0_seq1.p1 gnl/TRDRNA2_/TRDRNA2_81871_c0~~gnl/TRDRNA2_/TRDRNA2_81871_c0_seq1.p1  ORF type:complete len:210 (+),score=11.96 gnl/TRDRNA2_/TRDRNA2_81871_c0_seq1:10-639(+)